MDFFVIISSRDIFFENTIPKRKSLKWSFWDDIGRDTKDVLGLQFPYLIQSLGKNTHFTADSRGNTDLSSTTTSIKNQMVSLL